MRLAQKVHTTVTRAKTTRGSPQRSRSSTPLHLPALTSAGGSIIRRSMYNANWMAVVCAESRSTQYSPRTVRVTSASNDATMRGTKSSVMTGGSPTSTVTMLLPLCTEPRAFVNTQWKEPECPGSTLGTCKVNGKGQQHPCKRNGDGASEALRLQTGRGKTRNKRKGQAKGAVAPTHTVRWGWTSPSMAEPLWNHWAVMDRDDSAAKVSKRREQGGLILGCDFGLAP